MLFIIKFLFSLLLIADGFRLGIIPNSKAILNKKFSTRYDILNVDLGERSYPIYIGKGILQHRDEINKHIKSKKVLIVTNTLVGPLYSSLIRLMTIFT